MKIFFKIILTIVRIIIFILVFRFLITSYNSPYEITQQKNNWWILFLTFDIWLQIVISNNDD
jgi:hypothetical protein